MSQRDKIAQFISGEFLPDTAARDIPDDLDLMETGVVDSLGLLKLVAFLEQELQVVIAPEVMVPANFSSIAAMLKLIEPSDPAARP
jgi:acyl carrier protein